MIDLRNKKIGIENGMWDNYGLDCFRNCPQYYEWRIVKGVIKPGAKRTSADFGSGIHLALEHFYKNKMSPASIPEAVEKFVQFFQPKVDPADEKRTLVKGVELLEKYFNRYKSEPFDVTATEIGGVVELGDYLYTFRIDLLVEWQSPKGLFGVDHKTTSSINRVVAKPNNQITGYIYGLSEMYGEEVLGYILNSIGVYKEDEEIDKNAPKVISPKTGKLVYAKKEREIFIRSITSRTKKELMDWKQETLHLISQIKRCHEEDVWPKHTNFCSAFSSKCQYLDLCQSQDKDILQTMIDIGIYEQSWWQPYVGEGEDEEEGK